MKIRVLQIYIGTCCDSFLSSLDISLSCTKAPLTTVCVVETYRMSGWSSCGLVRVGNFCIWSFSASKASYCSDPHSKLPEPLRTLKNGKLHSTSFAINRFSATILPVSLCTSFPDCRGFMCTMVLILSGLTSIPFIDTKQPRTLSLHTSNTHFSGLSFNCALCILVKVSAKSCIWVVFFLLATMMSST
jgi:hypothetical protein